MRACELSDLPSPQPARRMLTPSLSQLLTLLPLHIFAVILAVAILSRMLILA